MLPDLSAWGEPIASLLKPEVLQKVRNRDVIAQAKLETLPREPNDPGEIKRYSYYAVMQVHSRLARTRHFLTDYQLYAKMVPYIDEAKYSPKTRILELKGGIWRFKLASWLLFEEKSDRWIHYTVVGGHFRGLSGDIFFEPVEIAQSQGRTQETLVYMRGEQSGTAFPPAFVIERGAEIVFEFTAKRMRTYIENPENVMERRAEPHDDPREIPKPRSHL